MNATELMRTRRPLTIEEMQFLEAEALKLARELNAEAESICERATSTDPTAARKLRASMTRMVENIEAAARIQWKADDTRALRELKLLLRDLEKLRRQIHSPGRPRHRLSFWRRNQDRD